jgi:hypothetical protein
VRLAIRPGLKLKGGVGVAQFRADRGQRRYSMAFARDEHVPPATGRILDVQTNEASILGLPWVVRHGNSPEARPYTSDLTCCTSPISGIFDHIGVQLG